MKILLSLVGMVISAYLLFAVLLYIFQRDFLYFPSGKTVHQQTIEMVSNDGALIEVIVLNKHKMNAVLYFGGNGESVINNAGDFLEYLDTHTIYLVNYRGYGGSNGSPSEQAIYSDAKTIFDIVTRRHISLSIIGRSLGSGVATYLASIRDVDKIVLVTPYDSIERIAQDRFLFLPMSFLLKDKYDSASRVKDISAETLVILAELDAVIPLKYSSGLIAAFPEEQVTVKTISGAGHNGLSTAEYYGFIYSFLNSIDE